MNIQLPPQTTRAAFNAICRDDFYSFVRAFFSLVSTSGRFIPNWHIEAMAYALDKVRRGETKRLINTVPPRYLKSICASVAFPAFLLGHDPTLRIICVSYSDALARSHASDFRAIVNSDRYREMFPGMRVSPQKDTETEVKTTERGFRYSTSVGGTLTGRGGNVLIIDDPQKPQDAHSTTARANLEQWYYNTLYPRLDSKVDDAIIMVMQRLHVDDIAGKLLDQGSWTHLNLPAIAQHDHDVEIGHGRVHHRKVGDILHPEREPLASLEVTKRGMGSLDFAAQYLQAPVPPEGNLIRWSWFRFYDDPPTRAPNDEIIISWDTALSSKELSSYSVGMVFQVRGERLFLLDVIRKQLEYPDLRRQVVQVYQRWRNATDRCYVLIENKGSGMSLIQDLKRDTDPVRAIAIDVHGDKVMRTMAQTAKLEAGLVYLPRKASWLGEFQRELMSFPRGNTDDQVDALSQALAYSSRQRAGWGTLIGLT